MSNAALSSVVGDLWSGAAQLHGEDKAMTSALVYESCMTGSYEFPNMPL